MAQYQINSRVYVLDNSDIYTMYVVGTRGDSLLLSSIPGAHIHSFVHHVSNVFNSLSEAHHANMSRLQTALEEAKKLEKVTLR